MDIKTHIKAGIWGGVFTGLLIGFIESVFLLFTTGSFLADFLFFLKAILLYGVVGAIGGGLLGSLFKISLLQETHWEEDQLKSFYFSVSLALSVFLVVTVYLLDIVFPLFARNFRTFLYIALTGLFSTILGIVLFKFFPSFGKLRTSSKLVEGIPLSKPGGGRWWVIPISFILLMVIYQGLLLAKERDEQQRYAPRKISTLRQAQDTASGQKPNILLIVMDTTRADRFSAYGHYRQTTPYIDKLAKEGRLFKNAFSPSTWTVPSHASLFTGVYPSKHGVGYLNNYMPEEMPTLAEILSRNGYRSLSVYNNVFAGRLVGAHKGFDEALGVGLDRRVSLTLERLVQRLIRKDIGARGKETVDVVFNWLTTTAKTGLPYFVFINFNDVHSPYQGREPYFTEFVKDLDLSQVDLSKVQQVNAHRRSFHKYFKGEVRPSPADFEYLKALYDSEIRFVDEQIGRLITSLKEKGFLKNTLVIITSDHGEYLGEHNLMSHHFYLYNTVLQIPLIFWYPERVPPSIETRHASLVDILPTVLAMTSLNHQVPAHVQGINLLPEGVQNANLISFTEPRVIFSEWWGWLLKEASQDGGKTVLEEFLTPDQILDLAKESHKDSSKAIFSEAWKLIWLSNGRHELYNLADDPEEQKNLIEVEPERARELHAKLEQWLGSFQQARTTSGSHKREFKQMLKSLGYVQ